MEDRNLTYPLKIGLPTLFLTAFFLNQIMVYVYVVTSC